MQPEDLIRRFGEVFSAPPERLSTAPGRVNLIGEHVDYNDGLVLPMAINREVTAVGRLCEGGRVRLHSVNFGQTREIPLGDARRTGDWTDYPIGVVRELVRCGAKVPGLEMALFGNVPLGAGLSSSAAVEVATGALVNDLAGAGLGLREVALAAQRAENDFVGTRCGIMDQFASALARRDHLLLLDCRTLETQDVPLPLDGLRVVLFDTRAPRRLVDSAYNRRREECERALRVVQARHPEVRALRDVTFAMLAECREGMDQTALKRATHVLEEIDRVRQVVTLLARGDVAGVGDLLSRSHLSLRDLYEVSCRELDIALNEGMAVEGVLGGRLTGAGFGGCLVFLVREEAVDRFARHTFARYRQETGIEPEIYVTDARDGARVRTVAEIG